MIGLPRNFIHVGHVGKPLEGSNAVSTSSLSARTKKNEPLKKNELTTHFSFYRL